MSVAPGVADAVGVAVGVDVTAGVGVAVGVGVVLGVGIGPRATASRWIVRVATPRMPLGSPVEVTTMSAVTRPSAIGVKVAMYGCALLLPGIKESVPADGFSENEPAPAPLIGSTVTIRVLALRPVFSTVKVFDSDAGAPFLELKFST